MPDAAWAVSVHLPSLSREKGQPPVLTSPNPLSTLLQRFACARLSQSYLPESGSDFSATFTTMALTTAACGGLRSTPDCRPRRALLHLSYSYASPCGPALLVTQDHCGSRGLVRPCTGVPDYFAPLFRFVDEESSKFGRGASKRSAAQNGKPI